MFVAPYQNRFVAPESICRAPQWRCRVARTDVWIFFFRRVRACHCVIMRVFFLDKETRGSFLLCSYPGRIYFVCWLFSSFFFVIACLKEFFMAGLPGPEIVLKPVALAAMTLPGMSSSPFMAGKLSRWNAAPAKRAQVLPACDPGSEGKTAVCRVKAGETRKEAVNSFKPTSTPSTAAASPAAVSRAAAKGKGR